MVLGVALLAYCPLDPIASLRDTTSIRLPLWYAGWRRMAALSARTNTSWPLPLTPQDWAPTPLAVQASVRALRDAVQQLHDGVETLAARRQQTSTTASRPPSLDAPDKQPRRRPTAATPRNAGGQPGPPGHRQVLCTRSQGPKLCNAPSADGRFRLYPLAFFSGQGQPVSAIKTPSLSTSRHAAWRCHGAVA
jgi:Family of unknown function (DUF6444)